MSAGKEIEELAVSIRGRCPKCNAPLTVDELRVSPTVCRSCETELKVLFKAGWVYTVVSCTIGVVLAYLQGLESIILGICGLFYGLVVLGVITTYRWELHLPIKVVEKPDLSLFPKDTS